MKRVVVAGALTFMLVLASTAAAQTPAPRGSVTVSPLPTPFPTRTVLEPAAPGAFEIVGAGVAIGMALVAGFLGYRVIRGGRGL